MLLVVAIVSAVLTVLLTSENMCALLYYVFVEQVLTFPLSWQTGIFWLLAQRLMKGSAIELIVARNCYRGPQYMCCS